MNFEVEDFFPVLKEAVEEARRDGFEPSASLLEDRAFAAYTTSSELLGESGLAIKEFLKENPRLSSSIRKKFEFCLLQIRKIWPGI